jgi:membrane protein YdbS with pleckstrin-like domain
MDGEEATPLTGAWLSPSPHLLRLRRIELVCATAAAAVTAAVLGDIFGDAAIGAIAAAATIVAGVAVAPLLGRRVRSWGYCEREDDLLVRRGLLVARLSVVPYGRMQFIDVEAGPAERLFGLATLHLHTAAAASDARIPGLDTAEAARLRDRLAALGEARAAGL